jgi:hypothetical protein
MAACEHVRPCALGTLFLELDLSAATGADRLRIDATIGGQTLHSVVSYGGHGSGGLELEFPRGYPAGQPITLQVVASRGSEDLAAGTTGATLGPECTRL